MAEEKFEIEVFKGKTFGKLLQEIHSNSRNTDKLLYQMIEDLKGYIESLGDAIQLAPIIASYVKMAIDNNEHIIKMAGIVEKSLQKAKESGDPSLAVFSAKDVEELTAIANEWEKQLEIPEEVSKKHEKLLTDSVTTNYEPKNVTVKTKKKKNGE